MRGWNWKLLLPMIALFVSPWLHKLIYLNLMAAVPGVFESNGAHAAALVGSLAALWITVMLAI